MTGLVLLLVHLFSSFIPVLDLRASQGIVHLDFNIISVKFIFGENFQLEIQF